jgi:hypothetical protein
MHHQCFAALQAALLCVVASIIAGAGVLITEFVRKMEMVGAWRPLLQHHCMRMQSL